MFSIGKAFEITYIRLKFYTSRPESFAIYKRTEEDGPWVPYQYYSASCKKTYRKEAKGYIRPGDDDERTALCTDEFSDISPLTGGNVAFSTLEGRPSAYNFDQSVLLQVRVHFVLCTLAVFFFKSWLTRLFLASPFVFYFSNWRSQLEKQHHDKLKNLKKKNVSWRDKCFKYIIHEKNLFTCLMPVVCFS